MASTYSTNLRLELIGTGEQQGTWGITTNTNLGTLLEEAIGGYISVAVTDGADTTLTVSNGAADQSRNMTLEFTGALTASRNVIAPAIEKVYIVKNSTTGGFAVTLKVSGQTGVSIPNGATYLVYVNGTDVIQASSMVTAGGTGITSYTIGDLLYASGTTTLSKLADVATGNALISGGVGVAPSWGKIGLTTHISGTLDVGNGGTGATTITGLVKGNGTSAFTAAVAGTDYAGVGNTNTFTANQIISVTDNTNAALRITQLGTAAALLVEDEANPDSTPFIVDATGNVGVGTTSPASKLDVNGVIRETTDFADVRLLTANNRGWRMGTGSNGTTLGNFYIQGTTDNFSSSFINSLYIDASGNVGIGTGSPDQMLTIQASDAAISLKDSGGTTRGYIGVGGAFGSAPTGSLRLRSDQGGLVYGYQGSEQLRIDTSGNVGIGTASPAFKLEVISATNDGIHLKDTSSTVYGGYFVESSQMALVTRSGHALRFGTSDATRMTIAANGEVYIADTTDRGAYNLQCNGTGVWGAGAYVNGSDSRIKDDIAPIESCLDIVSSLNPVTFKYKESWSKDQSIQPGFIAQELQAALSNTNYADGVVMQGPEYMSVAYQALIPVLTKALQELKAEFDDYKAAHP